MTSHLGRPPSFLSNFFRDRSGWSWSKLNLEAIEEVRRLSF